MKILMAVTYYHPHVSGLTIYVERIGEELVRRGHEVTVLTSSHLPGLPAREEIRGVQVVRLPVALRLNKGVVTPTLPIEAYRRARTHDAVHLHLPMADAPLVALAAHAAGTRIRTMTYHCDVILPRSLASHLIMRTLDLSHRLAAAHVDSMVTYTRDYASHSRFLSRFPGKVFTVYPPIVVERPDPDEVSRWRNQLALGGVPIVGFAGRFSEDKGGDYILESIPHLLRAVPHAKYLFAGEYRRVIGENFYEKVRDRIERNQEHIQFLGELHGRKLSNFYSMIDVLVLPSVNSTESFGMVQVEAMLCGTPVVASDIPGVRESVKISGMGRIVPPRDPRAIADALAEVLKHPDRYARPTIDLSSTFSVGQTVDFYERLYRGDMPVPAL